jgi:beta-N-acetylhexosaminidase
VSRRDVLRAGGLGILAAGLAACAPAVPSPPATEIAGEGSAEPPDGATSQAPTLPASPTQTASPSPDPSLPDLATMIAGLIVVGFRGRALDASPWLRDAIAAGLGGVILFSRDGRTGKARNVRSPTQVRHLTDELRAEAGGRPLIVAVDQEGGKVLRLSPAFGFPAVASQATVGRGSEAAARTWAKGLAGTLAKAGINLNLAPVVDLDVNPDSPAIGALGRSFSADPEVVTAMAAIEIDAHRAAGVLTALKHFPGIGSSTTNTDLGVADVTDTWTDVELEPFRRLIAADRADMVMVGHVVNSTLDPDRPASLSAPVVTDLLRGQLGWEGVVITDDMTAAAIDDRYGEDEAVLLALEAGNDLLLFANQQRYDTTVVERIVGTVQAAVDSGRLDRARIEGSWRRVRALLGGL